MLKTVFDKQDAARKRATRNSPKANISLDLNHPDVTRNPFKFIENAIRDAKNKIQDMEAPHKLD